MKDPTIGLIIRLLSEKSTKPGRTTVVHGDKLKLCHGETPKSWLEADGGLSDSVDLSESAAAVARDAVPVTPLPQPNVQLSISLREPTAVNAGGEVEVESDLPEVERTRQKRVRRPPADPRVVDAGSEIVPDMNSSKVRPTRPERVRFAPRYMNEYYLNYITPFRPRYGQQCDFTAGEAWLLLPISAKNRRSLVMGVRPTPSRLRSGYRRKTTSVRLLVSVAGAKNDSVVKVRL